MTDTIRTSLTPRVPERAIRTYTVTFSDASGTPIPKASINSITCSLRDEISGFHLRQNQNVLDVNGGSMGNTDGVFELTLSSLDNRIVNPIKRANTVETRVLTLIVVYNIGEGRDTHEVEYDVEALADV